MKGQPFSPAATGILHLTLASASPDDAAQLGGVSAPPAARVGRLRVSWALRHSLPAAAPLEPAGVRSSTGVADPDGACDALGLARNVARPAEVDLISVAQGRAEAEQAPGRTPTKHVVLVVDDDANIRESLAALLRLERYEVRLAENGRTAVRQFLDGPPDLVLLDLNMPDTDGWQAFEIMARLAPYVPVIVITARPYQARRAAEAGIDMLLEKPLDIPMLLETIHSLLATPEKSRFATVLRAWHTSDLPGAQD